MCRGATADVGTASRPPRPLLCVRVGGAALSGGNRTFVSGTEQTPPPSWRSDPVSASHEHAGAPRWTLKVLKSGNLMGMNGKASLQGMEGMEKEWELRVTVGEGV